MLRKEELTLPRSCLNRAADDEMLFVLLARDKAAVWAIRLWCLLRVFIYRLNKKGDAQIKEAWACASMMLAQQKGGLVGKESPVLRTSLHHLQAMSVSKGDVLVLTVGAVLSQDTARHLKDAVEKEFPGHKCLVLGEGMALGAVRFEKALGGASER